MSPLVGKLWYAAFLAKCLYFLLVDRIDRSRFNTLFYRSYAGLPADQTKAAADDCYREVIAPRWFAQARACVDEHRRTGRRIILVTGSLDFIMAPLAHQISADELVASTLGESSGCFTGMLTHAPISDDEKARRVQELARAHDLDLPRCYAYGDSVADLPMLEAVGHPRAVNPDKRLAAIARSRDWPVHRWTVGAAQAEVSA